MVSWAKNAPLSTENIQLSQNYQSKKLSADQQKFKVHISIFLVARRPEIMVCNIFGRESDIWPPHLLT